MKTYFCKRHVALCYTEFFKWMFLNSVKEINRLRKEIDRLLSKTMSNIYLKVTIKTLSKL